VAGIAWFGRGVCGQEAAEAEQPQPYLEDNVDENRKNDRTKVMQILRAGTFGAGEQALFEAYYHDYYFARWSQRKNLSLLTAYRKELRTTLRSAGTGNRPSEVHDHLNTLALEYFKKRANGRYYPATRYNAVLAIGELDSVEARPSKDPVPLPAAREFLLQTIAERQQPDWLIAGALVGIHRHVEVGINDSGVRNEIAGTVLDLAKSKRPANLSADGHAWMCGRAADVLGELKDPGEDGAAALALKNIVADSSLPWAGMPRTAAAEALGKLRYQNAGSLSAAVSQLVTALGQLALDACRAEAEAATIHRPRLKYRLYAAWIGLTGADEAHNTGVASLATGPPHQKLAAELRQSLEAMMKLLDSKELEDDDGVMEMIQKEVTQLRGVLTKKAEPEKAALTAERTGDNRR